MNNSVGWLGFLPLLFWFVVMASIGIPPFWKICTKAGLSKGLVAILFVPVFGWILLTWIIGFSNWPTAPMNDGKNAA